MIDNFVEPLDPVSFCQKWVPRLTNLTPDRRGYRVASCELLSYITGKSLGSVQNWFDAKLSSSRRQPELIVERYLRLVDLIWEIESLFPAASYYAKAKQYLQKLPSVRKPKI